MKRRFKIVECRYDNGEKYYSIEVKGLFGWRNYLMDIECRYFYPYYFDGIHSDVYGFESIDDAEEVLEHFREVKEYRGKRLEPCILDRERLLLGYYCDWGSEKTDYGIDYRIIGSEDECKVRIDKWIEREDNLRYKKDVLVRDVEYKNQ